jgi:hypothetical protein
MTEVTQVLGWESTDGSRRGIIIVKDDSVPATDVRHKQIELVKENTRTDEWETSETIDSIEELESFGIPETLID